MPVATRGDLNREHTLTTYLLTAEGLAEPSTHDTLQAAIDALLALITPLPLDRAQRRAYAYFLGAAGGTRRVEDYLREDGRFELEILLGGRPYCAVISPV